MSFISELKRRNVIRIAIAYAVLTWLVLQVSDVLTETLELPTTLGKIVLALLAIGFIPVLLFSWVYELTPEGLKREKDISPAQSITDHTAKRLDIAVIVLLVAAMGLFAADRFMGPRDVTSAAAAMTGAEDASIAVLPFLNLSNDPDNEYFSDGLTETLLHMLAQVQDIRVAARSSAFAFKGTNTDVREIAAQLNVATVLEGSVQRAGDRVRVTAQLIDANTGSQIWSQNFDRTIDDIFAIQDEIANSVASAMSTSLLGENGDTSNGAAAPRIETMSTRNTEAYEYYLRGLGPRAEGSHQTLPVAEAAFTEALLIDPGFREARLALVSTYLFMGDTALINRRESIERSRAALGPLITEGTSDPVLEGLIAFTEFLEEGARQYLDNDRHVEYYNRLTSAIARAPNEPLLYIAVAEVLDNMPGRGEDQLALIERGLEVDPFNVDLLVWKGRVLAGKLRRPDDALENYARMREVAPDNPNGYALPSFIFLQRGQYAEAFRAAAQATQIDRRDHELAAFAAGALIDVGLYDLADQWIERAELLDADGGATQAVKLMQLYFTEQHDAALDLAERMLRAQKTNRRGAYWLAASVYGVEMNRREKVDEAMTLIEELAPGAASNPGYDSQDPYGLALFQQAQLLKPGGLTQAEIDRWREVNEPQIDSFAPDWREQDNFITTRYFYGYDTLEKSASQLAAHIIEDHAFDGRTRIESERRALRPLYSHPEVQAAIETALAHHATEAERIRRMIESGEVPGA